MAIIFDERSLKHAARAVLAINPAARRNFPAGEAAMVQWMRDMTERDLGAGVGNIASYWSTLGVTVMTWWMDDGLHARAAVDAYGVLIHLNMPSEETKSDAIRDVGAALGVPVVDIPMPECDPEDMRGFPTLMKED